MQHSTFWTSDAAGSTDALGREIAQMRAAQWNRNQRHIDPRRPRRFLLWIDAVGGYWVCLGDAVSIGSAATPEGVDVPILGDLSRRHARIRRDGEGYLLEAIRAAEVDGQPVVGAAALVDGSQIRLGGSVRLVFRRPHALSATARLEFASSHRTQPTVDAVLLMADNCVLGPKPFSHVVCPKWRNEVILYRDGDRLFCRAGGDFEVDGQPRQRRSSITCNSRIVGDDFAMSLEAI